jgi:DNA-binding GntR family transcriptional regulator
MEALLKINTEFHGLLYAMSGSPKLIKMINDLQDQIYRFRRIILKIETMAKTSNDDHRQMLSAMKMRDADRVETLVRQHILRGQKIVLKELENGVREF